MRETLFFTIASANYFGYVKALHASLARLGFGEAFFCFLVDEVAGRIERGSVPFPVIETDSIGCARFFDMAARYHIVEMNTAVKPFCFEYLIRETAADRFVYLDPDIAAYTPFLELEALFDVGATVVLTPHVTSALDDGAHPDDQQLMKVGIYNLGFCAVRRSSEADRFLAWWGEHLATNCTVDIENGIFVDQKFCDLAPSLFDGVAILRHAGYNVAYWNLGYRRVVRGADGAYTVNGVPLRFMHYSGIDTGNPALVSKYQNRLTVFSIGDARRLFEEYVASFPRVESTAPYTYATLIDGTPITREMRRVYRHMFPPAPRARADAFAADVGRYVAFAPEFIGRDGPPITRLMYACWLLRDDLRARMALGTRRGREALAAWFFTNAKALAVPAAVLAATREVSRPCPKVPLAQLAKRGTTSPPTRWAAPRQSLTSLPPVLEIIGGTGSNALDAVARSHLRAARAVGLPVESHEIPFPVHTLPDRGVSGAPQHPLTGDTVLMHVNAQHASWVASQFDPRELARRHRIGYWTWELPRFPLDWVSAFDAVDEVWVPSRFVAEAVGARTRKPVMVVPPAVAAGPPVDVGGARRHFGLPLDRPVFLCAFDLASRIARKNPQGALRAFVDAFPPERDGPVLVVKLRGLSDRDPALAAFLGGVMARRDVVVLDRFIPADDVTVLLAACDVFVSLHRSEGFGLWVAEAMARGKTCIVTNFSGTVDYCAADNALVVEATLRPVGVDEYPFAGGQVWAEPSRDAAAAAFRAALDPELRASLGSAARDMMARRFSDQAVGASIRDRIYAARAETLPIAPLIVER